MTALPPSIISFPSTEKLTDDKPYLTIDVDTIDSLTYPSLIDKVTGSQGLIQKLKTDIISSIRKLSEVHDYYHPEVFDLIQFHYCNIKLLRVRNKSSNSGVSIEFNVKCELPPREPTMYEQLVNMWPVKL